ncbi:hypothetical protein EZ428_18085 [Pedobacter frigiditerrae]|uniref:Uncharacterized protein n=1 Tax=Pedobacter frigiditerrae TaxID=2530452 RepID=A0A4R0MP02_9SPHI|nr:hypothetical protein [Pedobacter frigiditerrae]TCC88551.1 hypothetical protein EZ428_18085 [Pedobacter frigiditerrae]
MTQEIKINLTLTLEADIQQPKTEIENFVNDLMINVTNTKTFSLQKYEVNKIEEEAEIYAPDPQRDEGVWEFVEKYYPKYYSCNEIMRNDDLCKIVNGELNGDAEKMFEKEFEGSLALATAAFEQSNKYVYERAIVGYQRSQQGTISILWGLQDVEDRAKDNGYELKKGEAQKVLDMLKDKHDCNIGITWEVIDDYLSYVVPDSVGDNGIEWVSIMYQGREYLGREIPDLQDKDFTLTVAPISLYKAMNLDVNGNGTPEATLKDELIAYYATEEELKLSNEELFNLIYN